MAQYNLSNVTRAGLDTGVKDISISPEHPESENSTSGISYFYYDNSDEYLGYYYDVPEIYSALKVFTNRVVGLGYTCDSLTDKILKNIRGINGETFTQIMENFLNCKKVFGIGIMQQIRNENSNLINLKVLYPGDLSVGIDENGMLDHFLLMNKINKSAKPKKLYPEDLIFQLNSRIANSVKGTSIIRTLKKIIDAKNEAMVDERKIRHREVMGILEVDTEDENEIATAIRAYQSAVNKKDVFITLKGVSEFKSPPQSPRDRIGYMQYLDSYFYTVVGTPKILVTSEGYTEAGGKAGIIAFEPTEIAEKKELEAMLWSQAAIKIEFTRNPSLIAQEQRTQEQNSGQTSIQKNETEVSASRTE
jgi:hypothetical protein